LTLVSIPGELPLASPATADRERADARRNRERILCAAARLIARDGLEHFSMDQVACEAGVGKGTLYRRFGDRASLLRALIDEHDRAFQEQLIRGPAPLGPGAPPAARLHAFGDGFLNLMDRNGEFIAAAEGMTPGLRFRVPVYVFYRTHVAVLLREIWGDDVRAEYFADVLMAPLAADFLLYQRTVRELDLEDLRRFWHTLADAVVAGGCPAQ
jgi:AcrR family transcriptional regulator